MKASNKKRMEVAVVFDGDSSGTALIPVQPEICLVEALVAAGFRIGDRIVIGPAPAAQQAPAAMDLYYPGNSRDDIEAADRKRGVVFTAEPGATFVTLPCVHAERVAALRPGRNACNVCDRQCIAVPRAAEAAQQAPAPAVAPNHRPDCPGCLDAPAAMQSADLATRCDALAAALEPDADQVRWTLQECAAVLRRDAMPAAQQVPAPAALPTCRWGCGNTPVRDGLCVECAPAPIEHSPALPEQERDIATLRQQVAQWRTLAEALSGAVEARRTAEGENHERNADRWLQVEERLRRERDEARAEVGRLREARSALAAGPEAEVQVEPLRRPSP